MSMGNGYHRESQARLHQATVDNGNPAPVVSSAGALVDDRDRGAVAVVARPQRGGAVQMQRVDAVDDVDVARQQTFEQLDRPGLQRLRQQRVIGVGEGRGRDVPGVVPAHAVQVDQDPHQFADGEARMRVVQLHRGLGGEATQLAFGIEVPFHEILQRRRDEKVFLPQPQFAAGRALVVGIEEFADRLGARLFGHRAEIVAGVEDVDPQWVGRARRPQPQCVDVLAAPADDRCVIGDGLHGLAGMPDGALAALGVGDAFDMAAEIDLVDHLGPLQFPGVAEAQPFVGIFLLPALQDDLPEQPEIVADAVADRRNPQRRHAFHEAGGQPAETAIAERGVGFAFPEVVEPDAEVAKRRVEHRQQAHIVERVGEQPADQEFERQVIDPLPSGVVALLVRHQPAVDDAVAQRQRGGLVPVVPGRHRGVLADGQCQLGEDGAFDVGQRQLVDRARRPRRRRGHCQRCLGRCLIWQTNPRAVRILNHSLIVGPPEPARVTSFRAGLPRI